MSLVVCKLPKAGLGNQLFPLMKAVSFAHLNNLEVVVTNYRQLKLGPWIRGEKNKRNYAALFTFQKSMVAALRNQLRVSKYKKSAIINEPTLQTLTGNIDRDVLYQVSAIPHYTRLFAELKENRPLVNELLIELIRPAVREKIKRLPSPVIGVHIRRGDFQKLSAGETFGSRGTVGTPEAYFIEMINAIRQMHGSALPVSVFTDGHENEFNQLFKLENVSMVAGNDDITDMVLLSKSKIIVTSAGSTFSYWAAFLSDAAVIMHPTYVNMVIRPKNADDRFYYGAWDEKNPQLTHIVKQINHD